jgi:integrase
MVINLNESVIANLQPNGKQYWIRDSKLSGFMVRVNRDGSKSYVIEYARGKRQTVGRVGDIPLAKARNTAEKIKVQAREGQLQVKAAPASTLTYQEYLDDYYFNWVKANTKTGMETYLMLKAMSVQDFSNKKLKELNQTFGAKKLSEISSVLVEKWKLYRLGKGIATSTINRNLGAFKASLQRAVEAGYLAVNPLSGVKLLKNPEPITRYLSNEEAARLHENLIKFPTNFQVMVVVSLNTGLRRGELLTLTWDSLKLNADIPQLLVKSEYSKTGKSRTVPLNHKALGALLRWQQQNDGKSQWVFPNPETGKPYNNVRKPWAKLLKISAIEEFRWHDMRHDCASQLAMKNVDILTISKILGHATVIMTQRYADLAPKTLAEAMAKLD